MDKSIYILSEPVHQGTHWNMQLFNAITARAAYHKLPVAVVDPDKLDSVPPECAPVMVIGATSSWNMAMLQKLRQRQLTALVVGSDLPQAWTGVSVITCNQARMAEVAVRSLYASGRKKLALVGYNPFSVNDQAKLDRMRQLCVQLGLPFSTADVFVFGGRMEQCIEAFAQRCENYDGVLCTNDVAGLYLVKNERLKHRIPEDLYVISFGDMLLGRLTSPSLTTISFNHSQMGVTAVNTLLYLRKNPEIACQHTAVNAQITPGETTRGEAANGYAFELETPVKEAHEYSGFYQSPGVQALFNVEKLFSSLDATEVKMVFMLLRGKKKNEITNALYISESTYKYRMRRLCETAGVDSREELVALLETWVDPEQLKRYLTEAPASR